MSEPWQEDPEAFIILRLQESSDPDSGHRAFQNVLAELTMLREEKKGLWRDRSAFVEREARLREELRFAESADDERDAELTRLREENNILKEMLYEWVAPAELADALKETTEMGGMGG